MPITNKDSEIVKAAISKLMMGKNLSRNESRLVMNEIIEKKATDAQISAYLVALRIKGETADEITGSAQALSDKTTPVKLKQEDIVDISGTGGDNLHTFNISTTAAFVTAGAGVKVAKHGQKSVSGKCGSADIVAELGVNINLDKRLISRCLHEVGLTFIFAPKFSKSSPYALGPRREIGARTIFNILSTLTNPARAKRQVIGIYDSALMQTVVDVLSELGTKQVMVVNGENGQDEISISGKTKVIELIDNKQYEYEIRPENFNLQSAPISVIQTESCSDNKKIILNILDGKPGPALDVVLLNAAAAIKVSGKVNSLTEGINLARESIESGAAKNILEKLIKQSWA